LISLFLTNIQTERIQFNEESLFNYVIKLC